MLDIKRSILLVIDVQGKLDNIMCDKYYLRHISCSMKVAQVLEIPIIVTEQAPEKIGSTIDEIHVIAPIIRTIQKKTFSCWAQPLFVKK